MSDPLTQKEEVTRLVVQMAKLCAKPARHFEGGDYFLLKHHLEAALQELEMDEPHLELVVLAEEIKSGEL